MDFPSLGGCVRAEVSLINLLSFSSRDFKEGGGNIFPPSYSVFLVTLESCIDLKS